MKLTPKSIFLLDAIGALVSFIFLYIILRKLIHLIGMPDDVLVFLAGFALGFFAYSLSCYIFVKSRHWRWLFVIIVANLLYCLLSLFYMFENYQSLTKLGVFYFSLEKLIVLYIVYVEYGLFKTSKNDVLKS